jgi:hypothetical protein
MVVPPEIDTVRGFPWVAAGETDVPFAGILKAEIRHPQPGVTVVGQRPTTDIPRKGQ